MFKEPKTFNFSENPYFKSMKVTSSCTEDIVPNETVTLKPTNLRVSTMTAICNINININLQELYNKLDIRSIDLDIVQDDNEINYPFIKSCQFGNGNIKGLSNKKPVKKRNKGKEKKRTYFQNQMTFIIHISRTRCVNLKIFLNGKIQMTGMKSQEEGYIACNRIIEEIEKLKIDYPEIIKEVEGQSNRCCINDFNIVLINCDFFAGCKLKREKLYDILYKKKYFVSYEPDIYPGVNAKFYWNKDTINTPHKGICMCDEPCDGKGLGTGKGDCKKITIATFQSGNIIITGARNRQQTQDAYDFINSIFRIHYQELVRLTSDNSKKKPSLDITDERLNINIEDIVNFPIRSKLLNKID